MVLIALDFAPAVGIAQSANILGGTLSWSATQEWQPCGNGEFEITQYNSFVFQFGSNTFPVNGSTAYISNSPGGQCPQDGPQGRVNYTVDSSLPFPINCALGFTPTGESGGQWLGSVSTQDCGIAADYPPSASTAYAFKNLQNLSTTQTSTYAWTDWTLCEGGCPLGNPQSGCCGSIANGIQSPSMSGASMELQNENTTGGYFDVLFSSNGSSQLDWNLAKGCGTPPCTFQNFLDDVWFYVPSSSQYGVEALEFDPDYTDPDHYSYKLSMECTSPNDTAEPSVWKYWYQPYNDWYSTGQSCANLWSNLGTWQHLQIYSTINSNHAYNYQAVYFAPANGQFTKIQWSGMTDYIPTKQQPTWEPDLFVEEEIDNTPAADTVAVYYDDYSMIVW